MQKIKVHITNERGLHARAAAKLIETANQFDASITLMTDKSERIDLSLLDIISSGIGFGRTITLSAEGTEATLALHALQSLVQNKFGEI